MPTRSDAAHSGGPFRRTRRNCSGGLEDGFVDKLGRDLLSSEPAAVELGDGGGGARLVGKLEEHVASGFALNLAVEDGAVLACLLHHVLAQIDEKLLRHARGVVAWACVQRGAAIFGGWAAFWACAARAWRGSGKGLLAEEDGEDGEAGRTGRTRTGRTAG